VAVSLSVVGCGDASDKPPLREKEIPEIVGKSLRTPATPEKGLEDDRLLVASLHESVKRDLTPTQARKLVLVEPTFDSDGRWDAGLVSLLRLSPDGSPLPDFASATEVIYWKRPTSQPALGQVTVAGLVWGQDGKPQAFFAEFVLP